jgi:hypothetical protein
VKTNGGPCESRIHEPDHCCFSHTVTRSDAEKHQAWQRGGYANTIMPAEVEVQEHPLRTRLEVARARERVFQLVQGRVVSAPVGATLLGALRDADAQRDRAEVLTLERRGRQPRQHVLDIRIDPTVLALAQQHRPAALPGVKRVGPGSETLR